MTVTNMNEGNQAVAQSSEVLTRGAFAARKRADLESLSFASLAETVKSIPSAAESHAHAMRGLEAFGAKRFDEAESAFDKAKQTFAANLQNLNIYAALCAFHAYSMWFCEGVGVHERIDSAEHLYLKACEIWLNQGDYENIAVHQRALAIMFILANRLRRARYYFGASLDLANCRKICLDSAQHNAWGDDYQDCSDLCEFC